MVCCMVLISNNPAFFSCHRQGLTVLPVSGTAYDVAVSARDRVHQGWKLLNHPLYGNFRPYHQPFRSLLLQSPASASAGACAAKAASGAVSSSALYGVPQVDADSLHLMEQALEVYRSCSDRWATPDAVPAALFNDCSFLDVELMKATLDIYCPL